MSEIATPICLIADQNLFHVLIEQDVDVSSLDFIEDSVAPIIVVDTTYDGIRGKLDGFDVMKKTVWGNALWVRSQRYENLLASGRRDKFDSLREVLSFRETLLPFVHKFNPGVSDDDATLMAAAYWIRMRTKTEPVIVAEDTDILISCHLISSYFGMSLGILSVFELMRLANFEDYVAAYCAHTGTPMPRLTYPNAVSRGDISAEIARLLGSASLSVHPRVRPPKTVHTIS